MTLDLTLPQTVVDFTWVAFGVGVSLLTLSLVTKNYRSIILSLMGFSIGIGLMAYSLSGGRDIDSPAYSETPPRRHNESEAEYKMRISHWEILAKPAIQARLKRWQDGEQPAEKNGPLACAIGLMFASISSFGIRVVSSANPPSA